MKTKTKSKYSENFLNNQNYIFSKKTICNKLYGYNIIDSYETKIWKKDEIINLYITFIPLLLTLLLVIVFHYFDATMILMLYFCLLPLILYIKILIIKNNILKRRQRKYSVFKKSIWLNSKYYLYEIKWEQKQNIY